MNDQKILNDLRIFAVLKKHEIPFVIIGGHAVFHHGYQRLTEDIDVVWRRTSETETRLALALTELNAVWIGKEIDPSTGIEKTYPVSIGYVQSHHLMMLWTGASPLDLFDYIPGHPNDDVENLFETAVEFKEMKFASLAWLRKMKQSTGRTKDLADLEELAKIHPQD